MENIFLLEDKLTKLFNSIVKEVPAEYGSWEDSDDNYYPVEHAAYKAGLGAETNVYCGASKVCAIVDSCDSVLKVPYNGYWAYYYEEIDEETGEVLQEEDEWFEEFCGADNSQNCYDYCLSEVEIYELAKEYGIEVFFPKTEAFGRCKSGMVIKQEKVHNFYNDKFQPSKASLEKVKSDRDLHFCDSRWVATAIDAYGEALVRKLIDFIDNVCYAVGEDLHCGNLGIRENGQPVILDFCGFNS